ncbi:MAG: cysteine peptidase family C39 domain-containing protein [Myxococcota bacterium]
MMRDAGLALVALVLACRGGDDPAPKPLAVPFVRQAHPATCLVAAASAVLRAHGDDAAHDALWREVRFWKDGTSDFEIQQAARRHGFDGFTFRARDGRELARIVDAGFPAIAAVDAPRKHALVVVGWRAREGAWRVHDPSAQAPSDEPATRFDARWATTGRQVLLLAPERARALDVLGTRGVDVARIARESRRYRAEEWRVRAARDFPDPRDPRRLELLRRAENE